MDINAHIRTFQTVPSHLRLQHLFQAGEEHGCEVSVRVDRERNPTRGTEVRLESLVTAYTNVEYMHKI
jgi:hypothetical protein